MTSASDPQGLAKAAVEGLTLITADRGDSGRELARTRAIEPSVILLRQLPDIVRAADVAGLLLANLTPAVASALGTGAFIVLPDSSTRSVSPTAFNRERLPPCTGRRTRPVPVRHQCLALPTSGAGSSASFGRWSWPAVTSRPARCYRRAGRYRAGERRGLPARRVIATIPLDIIEIVATMLFHSPRSGRSRDMTILISIRSWRGLLLTGFALVITMLLAPSASADELASSNDGTYFSASPGFHDWQLGPYAWEVLRQPPCSPNRQC